MTMMAEREPLTIESAFSPADTERMTSLASVINYLLQNGFISISPDSKVLDLGAGSGVGVYIWRAFGVREENITALDIKAATNPAFIGGSNFIKSSAHEYLESIAASQEFDIISTFRVPNGDKNFTGYASKEWLMRVVRALHERGFYLETRSEWLTYPFFGSHELFSKTCFSFMGDELEVPNLPLLAPYHLPVKVRMGHPDGVYEVNEFLDGQRWIPCDSETGDPLPKVKPPVRVSSGYRFCRDEYDVAADHGSDGSKRYPFGKSREIEFYYGYTDNIIALYKRVRSVSPPLETKKVTARSFRQRFFSVLGLSIEK